MTYIDLIKKYEPYNEQESRDKKAILDFIDQNNDHLLRTNLVAHLTSSAIVLNKDYTKVLFAFHNIYQSWSWLGGHLDGDKDLLKVAIKEVKEETGIKNVIPFLNDIFMIDVIYVSNHIKHQKYVGDHLHLNVTFLLIGDESDELFVKEDENQDVKWFNLDDVLNHINEERMIPVFKKAINKIKQIIV
jgi:8-oxo-dGTP pyrophosphatase MutT (NUDIX family)